MSKSPLKKRIFRFSHKIINKITPKHKGRIYVEPHRNGKKDKYDLINCNSDNCLKLTNFLLNNYKGHKLDIVLEIYDIDRIQIINSYIKKINNHYVNIFLIESCWGDEKKNFNFDFIKRYIRNTILKFTSEIWIADTGWAHFFDNVKGQTLISLNYGAPFKKGGIEFDDFSHNHFDYICETSLMTAKIESSERHTDLDKILDIGFPRNDTLKYSDKKMAVRKWLKDNNADGKKIILYAPTFRKYDVDVSKTNIFGFEDYDELNVLLEKYNAIIVTKFHPHQRVYNADFSGNVLDFKCTYDFSVYDLMSISDVMISDYSSIIVDFFLTHKPSIFLFSDYDEYNDSRGFSFDPIQSVCYGDVVYTWDEMKVALSKALDGSWVETEDNKRIFSLWYKYDDFNATKRCYKLLKEVMNK
ncbi:MAG: CDP-glycerol glycerophosphotransferase family protein [Lachnospiraceae bacterium]|nr:CDP-glycerol glycerophosphotransferase family protein [Lachnospiraceae bacterium]